MIRAVHRLLVEIVLLPVVFYRRVLSPMKRTPSCIYLPTCSEYALEAVKTRGILVGVALAVVRLLRCNPLFHGGHDPVPGCHHRAAGSVSSATSLDVTSTAAGPAAHAPMPRLSLGTITRAGQ